MQGAAGHAREPTWAGGDGLVGLYAGDCRGAMGVRRELVKSAADPRLCRERYGQERRARCARRDGATRRTRTRRLAERMAGSAPAVRTDDGVRLEVRGRGPGSRTGDRRARTRLRPMRRDVRSAVDGAAQRTRLIRYDQRGQGESAWTGVLSGSRTRLGRDLGQLIDQLAADGLSWSSGTPWVAGTAIHRRASRSWSSSAAC